MNPRYLHGLSRTWFSASRAGSAVSTTMPCFTTLVPGLKLVSCAQVVLSESSLSLLQSEHKTQPFWKELRTLSWEVYNIITFLCLFTMLPCTACLCTVHVEVGRHLGGAGSPTTWGLGTELGHQAKQHPPRHHSVPRFSFSPSEQKSLELAQVLSGEPWEC